MPLYLLNSPYGFFAVRAATGGRAMELAGVDEADVTLLPPEGPEAVLAALAGAGEEEEPERREVEITALGDKERRFQNLDTRAIRCEPFERSANRR